MPKRTTIEMLVANAEELGEHIRNIRDRPDTGQIAVEIASLRRDLYILVAALLKERRP